MKLEELISIISDVQIMGGSVAEMMVTSEIVAIAEAVMNHQERSCGTNPFGEAPRSNWMAAIPTHMHDCFSS